ncbi:hypothetical protein LENED_012302 [Lentinula edodes]|uniref:Uncharacterized protein n=1 Tax=Lentinula edodes TaxID=5353 RepID=A0A1Q3ESI3_LENED|nr:hypothetical protein LENED_012302 [Lentinula edodes]
MGGEKLSSSSAAVGSIHLVTQDRSNGRGLMRFLCADTIQSRRVPEVIKGGAKKGQKSLTAGRHFPQGISKTLAPTSFKTTRCVLDITADPISASQRSAVPTSSPQSDSVTSYPQQHKSRADDSHHSEAQNPIASSSTAENTHDWSKMTKTDIMNAIKAQKIDIVFQYPEKNRPPIVSLSLQANVQRGSLLLVKAAMEALGIDIKPSFSINYSGFVSKPRSIEDRFKVWFLKKEDGGGGMDKLIEFTGFLKMRLKDKNVEKKEVGEKEVKEADKLVFYGKVIDSKGEPIVTLNHKGKIVPKKRPGPLNDDEPGTIKFLCRLFFERMTNCFDFMVYTVLLILSEVSCVQNVKLKNNDWDLSKL